MDRDTIARSQIEALRLRVEAIERSLETVFDRLGLEGSAMVASSSMAVEEEILSLLQQGDTIQAIKTYRERTGADLASAKSVVDRLAEQYGIR